MEFHPIQERNLQKTTFVVQKMDCPSEEQLIRLKLGDFKNIASLVFDIPNRKLDVYHTGEYLPIFKEIDLLDLDAQVAESSATVSDLPVHENGSERKLLLQVLFINFFFFLLEMLTGVLSHSMGLMADSLDMLADSLVYGLALYAIGSTLARKKSVAKVSGYFQMVLAVFGLIEVVRRFIGAEEVPAFQTMIVISLLALVGNATSLFLLQKSKNTEAHMQASMIFTSNDVIANLGVILAGGLVFFTNSKVPDLVIGAIVFLIVARGAYRILQIAK
jgi:Co/Zn/Cd efflux system component